MLSAAQLKPNQAKGQNFIILTSPLHHAPLIEIKSIICKQYFNVIMELKQQKKSRVGKLVFVHCHICSIRIKAMWQIWWLKLSKWLQFKNVPLSVSQSFLQIAKIYLHMCIMFLDETSQRMKILKLKIVRAKFCNKSATASAPHLRYPPQALGLNWNGLKKIAPQFQSLYIAI